MFYPLLKILKLEESLLKILKKKFKPKEELVDVQDKEIVRVTSEKKNE
jgi:hypothetical protein